jgi:hypothetical protein
VPRLVTLRSRNGLGAELTIDKIKLLLRLKAISFKGVSRKRGLYDLLLTGVVPELREELLLQLAERKTNKQKDEDAVDEMLEQVMEIMPNLKDDFPDVRDAIKRKNLKKLGLQGSQKTAPNSN